MTPPDSRSVYELVGDDTLKRLVWDFYARVEADPPLRAVFPDDLEPGKQWQYLFLVQYFGGPQTYMHQRGHPRLRMRHNPYPINAQARDRWLTHMLDAIDAVGITDPARAIMRDYFQSTAKFMVNTWSTPDAP